MDTGIRHRALQEAARWQARLGAEDCTEADRQAFLEWQRTHPERAQTTQLAHSVFAGVDELARQSRLRALADEAFAEYDDVNRRALRRWKVPAALAATLAFALFGFLLVIEPFPPPQPIAYETAASERREIILSDGSSIQLDTGTRLQVTMTADERVVNLLAGRAIFLVAHDVTRPFSVDAGGSRTTALGTQFQVQREEGQVTVTLTQGSVAIMPQDADSWQERLVPGEQLTFISATSQRSRKLVDPAILTSWRHGRHLFRATPLAEAVAEVNRYASRKVRLGDPALAELQVGGNFIAGDSEQIVAAFAAVLPVRIVQGGNNEIILFRSSESLPNR